MTGFIASAVALAVGASGLQAGQSQDAPPAMQGQQPMQGPPQMQGQPAFPNQGTRQYQPPMQSNAQTAHFSPQQMQELVAPIALYPDSLVAQILAASAYPTQIVEAERFLQQNPILKGSALGAQVDQQDWDPSVKALTQFPSVLSDLDKNLSWTTTLGDANVNQQTDVMDAIQFMRKQAEQAGNLKTTSQQTVQDQGPNVVIQPANPQVVYVPDYDPEYVYGYPVGIWPGFYPWWGVGGPYLSFGIGFGPFWGFGWGWGAWGFDWFHRGLLFGGRAYAFQGRGFYDHNAFFHGNYRGFAGSNARGSGFARGGASSFARGSGNSFARGGVPTTRPNSFAGGNAQSFARGNTTTSRGFSAPANRGNAFTGNRSGAVGGYSGGSARGYSSGGRVSGGGGGSYHGGGGGSHGGGGGHSGGGGHGGHR